MRPPRVAILVLFFSASLFLVCRSISSIRGPRSSATSSPLKKSSFGAAFFTTPFSLFPPSAAISLTDDNSTFFPARPAAFGPPLPTKGLSGQLWIGSGFADETFQEGEGEGELGCSDIPGWEDGKSGFAIKSPGEGLSGSRTGKTGPLAAAASNLEHDPAVDRVAVQKRRDQTKPKVTNDGTDNHLHQGLRNTQREGSATSASSHADIQSMQETAEITGKVVLLSRGGCGFLDKVKWAQRRGGIALIVGDNTKGGPLIQMFASGDTDNVTIPSVFTSRTTAHLLSSLMQPGSFIEDILSGEGDPLLRVRHSGKTGRTKNAEKPVLAARHVFKTKASAQENVIPMAKRYTAAKRSWVSRLFRWGDIQGVSPNSRPPSSGRLVDNVDNVNGKLVKNNLDKSAKDGVKGSAKASRDGSRIGVRKPNLVTSTAESDEGASDSQGFTSEHSRSNSLKTSARQANDVDGDSSADINKPESAGDSPTSRAGNSRTSSSSRARLLAMVRGGHKEAGDEPGHTPNEMQRSAVTTSDPPLSAADGNGVHEGLWVTITPTGSASPFFDTLLVLVISPLITLTVVYALLILRVKIRMRRWRAPKSVVEQLPVRTYQTVGPSPTQSPRTPSPTSSSPTTPLLQGSSRSRPRSRTTTDVPSTELLSPDDALPTTPRPPSPEKNARGQTSEWKKYMGRQVECVVCLEEYVDGVSKVMSLPCGHEFHAECM